MFRVSGLGRVFGDSEPRRRVTFDAHWQDQYLHPELLGGEFRENACLFWTTRNMPLPDGRRLSVPVYSRYRELLGMEIGMVARV